MVQLPKLSPGSNQTSHILPGCQRWNSLTASVALRFGIVIGRGADQTRPGGSDVAGAARRAGMSRLEVLVLSAVAAIVLALAGPWIMSSREAARRTQCERNLQRC